MTAEISYRDERRMERLLRAAKLRSGASIESFDFRASRGLDRSQVLSLANANWVRNHDQVAVLGPTGVGNYVELGVMVRNGHPLQQEGQMAVK